MGKIKVVVLGYGGRGKVYARLCQKHNQVYELMAVIDHVPAKLEAAKKECHLENKQLFSSLEDFLAEEKMADYLFVCTQDKDHIHHAIPSLEKGYDILLEKPIATSVEDCVAIEQKALELGRKVAVCHVLRYSVYYEKIKEVMDSGVLGDIVSVDQIENVAYWHQSHSFVRGDWGSSEVALPMILAKCCHDLDIAVFLVGDACESVSSRGKLHHFKPENAPEGAALRCMDGCTAKEDCPYDAEKLYIKTLKRIPKPFRYPNIWPQSRLMEDGRVTLEKVEKAVKEGQFGRCVYHCDNDVVDYQVVIMAFANGIQSTLTMTAFSEKCFRETRVRGTKGELVANMDTGDMFVYEFGKRKKRVKGVRGLDAHGGGDERLIMALAEGRLTTDITASIESHLMGFAAEQSRLNDGNAVRIEELRKQYL